MLRPLYPALSHVTMNMISILTTTQTTFSFQHTVFESSEHRLFGIRLVFGPKAMRVLSSTQHAVIML